MKFNKKSRALSRLLLVVVIMVIILVAGAMSLKAPANNTVVYGIYDAQQLYAVSAVQKLSVDQTPIMGWSSWSFLRIGANVSQIEGEARALISTGLSSVGYQYINVDDGWYQCPGPQGPNVDQYGRWVINSTNYPREGSENGIEGLAAYVHSLGLKFGIYETAGISEQAV